MIEKTIEQLKQDIAIAATTGDDTSFNALIKEYNSRKAEVAKALQEAARKEAEALAGVRQDESMAIYKDIKKLVPEIVKRLEAVKATGFTFKLDYPDVNGVMTHVKSVALAVPAIKTAKGGARISSKGEYGMSLDEIFQQFATDEEKAKLKAAEGNSAKWQIKNAVKKAALKAGLLQPAK